MTISLEEHVARAIFNAYEDNFTWDDFENQHPHYMRHASAAIAAVLEYGEPANGVCNKCGYCGPVERHGFDQGRHPNCNYAASIVPPPDAASIRESERAACEAITRERLAMAEKEKQRAYHNTPEAMAYWEGQHDASSEVLDAIAARKGKGDGK